MTREVTEGERLNAHRILGHVESMCSRAEELGSSLARLLHQADGVAMRAERIEELLPRYVECLGKDWGQRLTFELSRLFETMRGIPCRATERRTKKAVRVPGAAAVLGSETQAFSSSMWAYMRGELVYLVHAEVADRLSLDWRSATDEELREAAAMVLVREPSPPAESPCERWDGRALKEGIDRAAKLAAKRLTERAERAKNGGAS